MRDTDGEAGGTEEAGRGKGSVEAEGKGDWTRVDGDNSAGVAAGVLAVEDSVLTVDGGTCKGVSERGNNICEEGEDFSIREEEEELTFCAAKGKVNLSKTTSRGIYNLPVGI